MSETTLNELLKLDMSEYATRPYDLTHVPDTKKQPVLLADVLRGSQINDEWKTPAIDTLTQISDRKPTTIENWAWSLATTSVDTVKTLPSKAIITALTNPSGFAAGTIGSIAGMGAGSALAGTAASKLALGNFWTKALTFTGATGLGFGGALAGGVAVEAGVKATKEKVKNVQDLFSEETQQKTLSNLEEINGFQAQNT